MDSANANKDIFTWTDSEVELLLECIKSFASNYSVTKERISGKVKSLRLKYKKAVDLNNRSGGGRLVMIFYDLCCEIWGGAPATNSIQGAIASSTFRDDVENEESFQSSDESPITEEITCNTSGSTCDSAAEGCDPEISVTRSSEPHILVQNQTGERTDRIACFLQDERERRMTPKISFEKQQLKYMKEDMEF
eukprot:gene19550-21482_t